jgi:hypothetical protein
VLFPQLYDKCQGITRKDGARPALPNLLPNFFLVIVMCVPSSILCVLFVCKCILLPPGVNPIVVIIIIIIIISCSKKNLRFSLTTSFVAMTGLK